MSTVSNPTAARRTDAIENLLRIWLAAGALACLIFPPLRGHDPLFGWLPFWLVAAPLIDLGVLHRQRLPAAVNTIVVNASRIRRTRGRSTQQARRLRRDQSLIPSRLRSMRRRNSDMMRRYRSSPR